MNRYPDRELFPFPSKRGRNGKSTLHRFSGERENLGKAGKAGRLTLEVLFRAWEKLPSNMTTFPQQKKACFSRAWEKVEEGHEAAPGPSAGEAV
jgi:hypothetical protein